MARGIFQPYGRFHLQENVRRADEKLVAQVADAPAPFWQHVRDALRTKEAETEHRLL